MLRSCLSRRPMRLARPPLGAAVRRLRCSPVVWLRRLTIAPVLARKGDEGLPWTRSEVWTMTILFLAFRPELCCGVQT